MPLELRTQRDGSLRPTWYGRYEINGRLVRPNLFIKIAGTPPASRSLRDEGNGAFERSRATAQAKLDGIVEEARTKQGSARLVEKLYEIKTGEIIRSVLLENLPEEWAKIARRRKPNARYSSQCQSTLKRFAGFVQQAHPNSNHGNFELRDSNNPTLRCPAVSPREIGKDFLCWKYQELFRLH